MGESVGLDLIVNAADSARTVGELKRAIMDLKTASIQAAEAGDEALARRYAIAAGRAKDKVDDLNQAVNTFRDSGSRLGVVIGTAQGIAGGFAAAQGAMALFGSESKEVEKALLKVQAAVALVSGFQGIAEGVKQFGLLRQVIIASVQSVGLLKAALITTGVGALTVAIGYLISTTQKETEVVKENKIAYEDANKAIDASTSSREKLRKEIFALRLQTKLEAGEINKQQFDRLNAEQDFNKALEDLAKQRSAAILKATGKLEKELQTPSEIYGAQAVIRAFDEEESLLKEKFSVTTNLIEAQHATRKQIVIEKVDSLQTGIRDLLKRGDDQILEDKKISDKEYTDQLLSVSDTVQRIQYERLQNTLAVSQQVGLGVQSLGNIFINDSKKLEAWNKKLVAVQIGIDTASAISSVVRTAAKNPLNLAPGALALNIASQVAIILANIAKAKQLLGSSGSSGSVSLGGGGGGSGGGSIPTGTQFSAGTSTILPDSEIDRRQGRTILKAYVVESEIKQTSSRLEMIRGNATLGE